MFYSLYLSFPKLQKQWKCLEWVEKAGETRCSFRTSASNVWVTHIHIYIIHPFLNAISYWWYISKMQYVLGSPSLISLKVKQQRTFLPFLWQWSHGWKSNDYFLLRSLFWELREKRSNNLLKNYWNFFLFRSTFCPNFYTSDFREGDSC